MDLTSFITVKLASIDLGTLQWQILIILAALTVAVLLLLVRSLSKGSKVKSAPSIDDVPQEQDVGLKIVEKVEGDIRPLFEGVESEFIPPQRTGEPGAEIRPLLGAEEEGECGFCAIFRDLGTAVCPNCGKSFRKPLVVEKESN